jgi:electron transfer flavoprotein alpha subunit
MILVIAEQRGGKLNRATWETIAAAQQLASGQPITVILPVSGAGPVAQELATAKVEAVVTVDHAALEPYTSDGYTAALQQAIEQLAPTAVLLPHTYQTRDFAPTLAARMNRALITDVTAIKNATGETAFVRPMFQGKLTADVVPLGPDPHFITFQIGAFPDHLKGPGPPPVRALNVASTRRRSVRSGAVPGGKQAVDLSGRSARGGRAGHQGRNTCCGGLAAEALGAGWPLPADLRLRLAADGATIGSSGQTVAPYTSRSASRRHPTRRRHEGVSDDCRDQQDADAPIFEVADYGTGDLFEIAPAIVAELQEVTAFESS